MIVLNTPQNPVGKPGVHIHESSRSHLVYQGKVFSKQELESIAEVAIERNLLVLSDEVVSVSPLLFLLSFL